MYTKIVLLTTKILFMYFFYVGRYDLLKFIIGRVEEADSYIIYFFAYFLAEKYYNITKNTDNRDLIDLLGSSYITRWMVHPWENFDVLVEFQNKSHYDIFKIIAYIINQDPEKFNEHQCMKFFATKRYTLVHHFKSTYITTSKTVNKDYICHVVVFFNVDPLDKIIIDQACKNYVVSFINRNFGFIAHDITHIITDMIY